MAGAPANSGAAAASELLHLVAGQERKERGRDTRVLAIAGALHPQGREAERLAQEALRDTNGLYAGERYGRLATLQKAALDVQEVPLAGERETRVGEDGSCYRKQPGQEQARGHQDQDHHEPVRREGLDEAPDVIFREEVVQELKPDGEHGEGDPDLAARGPGEQQLARREPPEDRRACGLLETLPPGTFDLTPQRLCRIPVQRSEGGVGLARASARRLDPDLVDAEGALDDPLHGIHRLYVLQRYGPFVLLEVRPGANGKSCR